MQNVLSLHLDAVQPDQDQPRKDFDSAALKELKAAIERWGLTHPIIVRKHEGAHIIVDGERRWRALTELHKEHPDDDKFKTIDAIEGNADDDHAIYRKAKQLLSNSTAQDLSPAEKVDVMSTLSQGNGALSSSDGLGLTKNQQRTLKQLTAAPDYIKDFGRARIYEIKVRAENGDGETKVEKREAAPLPFTHLVELATFDKALRAWDAERLKETKNEHAPVAVAEVTKLGERAQRDEWSRTKLRATCVAVLERLRGEKPKKEKTAFSAASKAITKIESELDKLSAGGDIEQFDEVISALEELLRRVKQAKAA